MLRATLKSLLARKLRLFLTALAIVLGVGFIAGTLMLTDTATSAFDDLFVEVFAGTDVAVQPTLEFQPGAGGPGGGGGGGTFGDPIPEAVLADVQAVQGVATASGDVAGYAQMIDPETDEPIVNGGAPTLGNSWDSNVSTIQLREGEPPLGSDVVVDAGTAKDHALEIGQDIRIVTSVGTETFTISGIAGFGDQDSLLGATLALFELPTAQRLFDREGTFDAIYVKGDGSVTPEVLRSRVDEVLPEGFEAITAADAARQGAEQTEQALGFLRTGLLVFAFVSVFVGAFLIVNTFTIIVVQRTRELGLLRAVGASRNQVLASVLLEALIVGLFASVVGLVVGLGLAQGLKALMAALGLELPPTSTVIASRTIVVTVLVGTVVTLVSALLPALRASRVSPIEALRDGAAPGASLRRRSIVGAVVLSLGVAALVVGLFTGVDDPAQMVGLGAFLTFIGVAVLSPIAVRPLAGTIGAPLRRAGISGRLGRENALRNPRRTASTAAALMIGLGLVAFVTVFAASLKTSASAALDEALRADFVLTSTQFTPFSPEVASTLAGDPAFAAAMPIRQAEARLSDGGSTFFAAIDPAAAGLVLDTSAVDGAVADLSQPGTVSVYETEAAGRGIEVGDTIELTFARTGAQELAVVAIHADNSLLNDYAVSLDTYDENVATALDQFVLAALNDGVTAEEGRAAIDEVLVDYPNVQARDQTEFKAEQAAAIDQVLGFTVLMLLLSIVIAIFGIINTLGLSIHERMRELGLLRAVGMSRLQVRRMVRTEAVLIAVLGGVLGLAVGVVFGWALQRSLADLGIDRLTIPVGRLAVYLVITALVGLLAAWWPAWRASKTDVLRAIAYE